MTVAEHIDQVVSADLVLHGWDLARATGQDETMDPDRGRGNVGREYRSTAGGHGKAPHTRRFRSRRRRLRSRGTGPRRCPAAGPLARLIGRDPKSAKAHQAGSAVASASSARCSI